MAVRFTDGDRKFFPLINTDAVVALFREQLTNRKQPNLSLLSIILGALEGNLTASKSAPPTSSDSGKDTSSADGNYAAIPALQLSIVEALYEQFATVIKGSVDLSAHAGARFTKEEVVRRVSDVVWGMLTRSFYKDRAHLQTVFSLLTGNVYKRC